MSTSASSCSGGSPIRQESSSLELASALSCLPPLCAIFHICIHLSTSILFLTPESMQKALNVLDLWRTLAFVVQHPLFALLPPGLDFFVDRSTVCFFFIWILLLPLAALLNSSSYSFSRDFPVGATVYIRSDNTFQVSWDLTESCKDRSSKFITQKKIFPQTKFCNGNYTAL